MTQRIPFGVKAKDIITGFEGLVTGYCQYMTGCDQYVIVAPAKDGKTGNSAWFDDARVEVMDEAAVTLPAIEGNKPGGPSAHEPAPALD